MTRIAILDDYRIAGSRGRIAFLKENPVRVLNG